MPVSVMEPSLNDDQNKKNTGDDKTKESKKISDFFKTPEKEVTSKQKSLLQFFTKSSTSTNNSNPDSDSTGTLKNTETGKVYQHTIADIIDIANTDKENVQKSNLNSTDHSAQGEDTTVQSKSKDKSGNKKKTKTEHEEESKVGSKKPKKSKKKKRETNTNTESDSIILLSDSSLSNPPSIEAHDSCTNEEKIINSKNTEVQVSNDKGLDIEANNIENDKKHVPKSDIEETEETAQSKDCQVDRNIIENEKIIDCTNNEENDNLNKNEAVFRVPTSKLNTSKSIDLKSKDITNNGNLCKKESMKGKDMMSLLKQIQGKETKDKKKHKKHKHKSKHKVKAPGTDKDNCDIVEDSETVLESESGKSDINVDADMSKDVINDTGKNEKVHKKKHKKSKKGHDNKSKCSDKEQVTNKINETNSKEISYDDFKSTIDSKNTVAITDIEVDIKPEGINDNPHEISYTDFLSTLDNKADEVDGKIDEMEVQEIEQFENETDCESLHKQAEVSHVNMHPKKKLSKAVNNEMKDTETDLSAKTENKAVNKGISKFFSTMTSTPDKSKADIVMTKTDSEAKHVIKAEPKPKRKYKLKNPKTKETEEDKNNVKSSEEHKKNKKLKDDILPIENPVGTENVKVDEEKCQKKIEFLNSGNTTSIPLKTTQSTLCFGKSGLTMSKPQPVEINDVEEAESEKDDNDTPAKKTKSKKKKHLKRKAAEVTEINTSCDSSVFSTPVNNRKRAKVDYSDANESMMNQLDESDITDETGERRRSLRKKYKVAVFQLDEDSGTPIKIKLKRCPKSSSGCDEGDLIQTKIKKTKLNAKQSKAQKLLEKAKKGKHKQKTQLTDQVDKEALKEEKRLKKEKKRKKKEKKKRRQSGDSDSSSTRRSSRLVGRTMASMEDVSLENIVILSDDEDGTKSVKKGAKRGRPFKVSTTLVEDSAQTPKKTPKKKSSTSSTGTPNKAKKAGVKMAPMFMMGKKASVESPKKPPLDPELARQRQQFLMSGVPDELKKQTVIRLAAMVTADYPPIPTVNHVQQIPSLQSSTITPDVWRLGPVLLKLRQCLMPSLFIPKTKLTRYLTSRQSCLTDLKCIKSFKGHSPLDESLLAAYLSEVTSFNSSYPVQKMYNCMKHHLTDTATPAVNIGPAVPTDMAGVLTEPVIVIDGDKEKKKRGRPSLKLQKKDTTVDKQEDKVDDTPKPAVPPPSCSLWTEKYYPGTSSEVLGNSGALKRMKAWLTEWKQLLDREAKKAHKLLMKKNKGKLGASNKDIDVAWDDDSDFDLDSEDDDDSICNTMLLVGPHGSGKTSSVYALAQELGFKVHEVNASSSRNGKHILSQLQEATQSHQVSSHGCHTPSKKPAPAPLKKSEQSGKMPTSFTNLFQKSEPACKPGHEDGEKGKKRKRHKSDKEDSPKKKRKKAEEMTIKMKETRKAQLMIEDSNSQSTQSHSLNLSSTTMILFDEVDVVFEDDRGFLAAVQTFMSTTKIPIVLTTADRGCTSVFDGKAEKLKFKRPPVASLSSHLQTIALVEDVRIDPVTLSHLVQLYDSDVRRCITCLQYLTDTGGSHIQSHRAIQQPQVTVDNTSTLKHNTEDSQTSQETNTRFKTEIQIVKDGDDDDDDFVTIKPLRTRPRRVLDDENSNSNSPEVFSSIYRSQPAGLVSCPSDDTEARKYTVVHSLCLGSILGTSDSGNNTIEQTLRKCLKESSLINTQEMSSICEVVKTTTGAHVIYNNLCTLLPMATKTINCATACLDNIEKTKTKTRKRIQNDLYDSEASNDATEVSQEETIDTESEVKQTENKAEELCLLESLTSLSNFYDSMSCIDVLETKESMKMLLKPQACAGKQRVRGKVVAGMENDLANFLTPCSVDIDWCHDYTSDIEAHSASRLYTEIDKVQSKVEKLCQDNPAFSDKFVLPVLRGTDRFTLMNSSFDSPWRTYDNIQDNLPLVVHQHERSIHLDYLPTLRNICQIEHCRELTNTKRRFHHYFDSIGLNVKHRGQDVLTTTFLM